VPDRPTANIEVKVRCRDLGAARERAVRIADARLGLDRQVDTYFRTAAGRLKLRESSLSGSQLIPYLRPDEAGPRRSDYRVIPVDDGLGLRDLLGRILGIQRVVRKEREILLVENVRIHLDRVEGLGDFVEFEAVLPPGEISAAVEERERTKVRRLMEALGVAEEDVVPTSYEALLEAGR